VELLRENYRVAISPFNCENNHVATRELNECSENKSKEDTVSEIKRSEDGISFLFPESIFDQDNESDDEGEAERDEESKIRIKEESNASNNFHPIFNELRDEFIKTDRV